MQGPNETVYVTVAVPADTPVTSPVVATVALVLEQLHVPPPAASDKLITESIQTTLVPDMDPADGIGFTVIMVVATMVLHAFETE